MLWNTKWFPGTNLQDINLDWILKKVGALRGGRTGQYLYKKSDKDFDFGWKTGGGGGGGASDYLDLDNKPSINNVELIGNKTASDLGLASASDIPVVPVRSVNGKTGAVELDASDVGAYVKPATGIPKTDLSSAIQESLDKADSAYSKPATGIPKTDLDSDVQASLSKADTALQAVPPAYRTAAAQDTIDAAQDAKIDSIAGSLAMVESSPATTAHVVGEYIVYNGQLYKVSAAISAGQTLTVGTNITQAKIADDFAESQKEYPTVRVDIGTNTFIAYSKKAGIVTLQMRFSAQYMTLNSWASQSMGTLPEGFRPAIYTVFTANVDRSEAIGSAFTIQNDGAITFSPRFGKFLDTTNIANATFCYPGT